MSRLAARIATRIAALSAATPLDSSLAASFAAFLAARLPAPPADPAWLAPLRFLAALGAAAWPALPFLAASLLYAVAARRASRRSRPWPLRRSLLWHAGTLAAAAAAVGPASNAHASFQAHMLAHLLLGMAAPLLLALAAPATLAARALPTAAARRLARFLRTPLCRAAADPAVAALFHVGGLWLLYRTDLYAAMHHRLWLHLLVHAHLFLAGCLFAFALVSVDPSPHRPGFRYRAAALLLAAAAHGALSKAIYAAPPAGVPIADAEVGAMLMYYGGDIATIALTAAFCRQWYAAAEPRRARGGAEAAPSAPSPPTPEATSGTPTGSSS